RRGGQRKSRTLRSTSGLFRRASVQDSITCSVGSGSEKSVSDARKLRRERRASFRLLSRSFLPSSSVLAPGVQRRPVGTRSRGKEKCVLGTEQNDRPPPPRGTVDGGPACRR